MSEFKEIFKKVNGWGVLKEYARAHVLGLVMAETALLGTSRKSLEIVRLSANNKIVSRLRKQNKALIKDFVKKHPVQKKYDHRRTIWTIWLQGMDQAPEVVQKCYASMKKNIKDREIVVITEDNYSDYVEFPDYIMEKYHKGIISKVHFADLLRIELLTKYGGTWLDGTVLVSEIDPEKHAFYLDSDLFLFQNLKPGLDGHSTSISSWMMTASSRQNIILLVRRLLHNYWKTHDYAVDYFILHDFFQLAIEAYPDEWKKVVPISNAMPHVVLLRLFDKYDENVWNCVKSVTPFHKLSYKLEDGKSKLKDTYYDVLLK
ncbi:MAG: capsular polysaccharide synthesis protein [Eubacterium sp.]|nr:capsular polysaccharide synthesis protein [Eubacterium sp.]